MELLKSAMDHVFKDFSRRCYGADNLLTIHGIPTATVRENRKRLRQQSIDLFVMSGRIYQVIRFPH